MTEFTDIRQVYHRIMEPHNEDDRGLVIKPGQRLKISDSDGASMVFDRNELMRALDFLDKQREAA